MKNSLFSVKTNHKNHGMSGWFSTRPQGSLRLNTRRKDKQNWRGPSVMAVGTGRKLSSKQRWLQRPILLSYWKLRGEKGKSKDVKIVNRSKHIEEKNNRTKRWWSGSLAVQSRSLYNRANSGNLTIACLKWPTAQSANRAISGNLTSSRTTGCLSKRDSLIARRLHFPLQVLNCFNNR